MVLKRIFIALLVIMAAMVAVGFAAKHYGMQLLQQPFTVEQPFLLEVKRGDHARRLIQRLNDQGLAIPETPAYIASRVFSQPERLQAGIYEITSQHNLAKLWSQLRRGDQYQFQVTLIEGQTFNQWLTRLANSPYLLVEVAKENQAEAAKLVREKLQLDEDQALEGLFYPETYHYYAGTSDVEILRDAYQRMQKLLAEVWQARAADLPYNTPYELLIMASIIEKETGVQGERAKVSSVFVNRLRIGMRLQSDPTTIYGIEDFDGNLTRKHLREHTLFNTYRINGLPPTPIAIPSRASLVAAAHPESTDYFYFVANGQGGHVFSKTLREHNRAVNRYQRNRK